MAKYRIGFSSQFTLTDGKVGIGTTNPISKLSVLGDVNVVGVITSSAFSGDNYNAYPFYSGVTSSTYASPSGIMTPVLQFSPTPNRRYIIHSINVANKARFQPQGAGATVSISTATGAVTFLTLTGAGTGYTSADTFVGFGTTNAQNLVPGLISFATTTFIGLGTVGDPEYIGVTSAIGIITAVSGGAITGVAITYGGFGYTNIPIVTIRPPEGGGTQATGVATVTYGEVVSAFLTTPGTGYVEPPVVSILSGTGTFATIIPQVDSDGKLLNLAVTERGYGYSRLNVLGNNEENEVYISLPGLAKTEVGVDVRIDRFPVGGGTTVESYLAFDVPIPIGGSVEILKKPAVLNPNDIIQLRGIDFDGSGLSNAIDVCISYEETTNLNFIGFGTITGVNSGLGTAILNVGIISATTRPILVESLRFTNTEFVGDYDISVKVVTGVGQTFYLVRNLMLPAFSSVELCETPRRLQIGDQLLLDNETVGVDDNLPQTIDIQLSGRTITF